MRDRLGLRRGTKATWQRPSGPRAAQVVLTRGKGATRTGHVDAREGGHVARLVSGGPTGIVGPGYMFGAVTQ